jgi:hypothetical protein
MKGLCGCLVVGRRIGVLVNWGTAPELIVWPKMRTAHRWAIPVAVFLAVLFVAVGLAFVASGSCRALAVSETFRCRDGSRAFANLFFYAAPGFAASFAAIAAPVVSRRLGLAAVVVGVLIQAVYLWSRVRGNFSPVSDVMPIMVMTLLSTLVMLLLVSLIKAWQCRRC